MSIPSTYSDLVHSYHKLAEQVVPTGIIRSLSYVNWLKLLHLQSNPLPSHYTVPPFWINKLIEAVWYGCTLGERSSAVEHSVHIGDVTGSIPVAPTTPRKYPSSSVDQQRPVAPSPRLAGLRPDPFLVFDIT